MEQEVYLLTDQGGLDLSQRLWYFLDNKEFNKETEVNVKPRRMPSRLPLNLSEGSGWLICNVPVPDDPSSEATYYATEVIIGHIEGDDRTYWNDTLIGETVGKSQAPGHLHPRRYLVPRTALMRGKTNQLRIQVSGYGDSGVVPRVEGPLTLAPLTSVDFDRHLDEYHRQIEQMYRKIFRVSRWNPRSLQMLDFSSFRENALIEFDQLRRLRLDRQWESMENSFRELDRTLGSMEHLFTKLEKEKKELENSRHENRLLAIAAREGVYAKNYKELSQRFWSAPSQRPNGFARWGGRFEDGLPSMIKVTPTSIESRDGQKILFRVNRVFSVSVVDITWLSKTYLVRAEVELDGRTEQVTFEVVTSVLYPGFAVFPHFDVYSSLFRPESLLQFFDIVNAENVPLKYLMKYPADPPQEGGSAILMWDDQEQDIPALLRVTPHLREVMAVHLTGCFPSGIRRMDTRDWKDAKKTPKNLSSFPNIEYLSRNIPVDVREYYRIDEEAGVVKVYDIFEYYYSSPHEKLVVIPPMLSFAAKQGYPVKFRDEVFDLGIDTQLGPLQGVMTRDGVLEYTLPLPALKEWLRPAVGNNAIQWQEPLFKSLQAWPRTTGETAVETFYQGVGPVYNALPLLSHKQQQFVGRDIRRSLVVGIRDNFWSRWTEPFSDIPIYGIPDRFNLFLEGDGFPRSCGLSLYGAMKYCEYWGDWRVWQVNSTAYERMWQWLKSADDWAWMRCGNAQFGQDTGDGNDTLAVYSGALAYSRINKRIDPERGEEGQLILARSAVSLYSLIAYTDWARKQGFIDSSETVVGIREGGGFVTASLENDPEGVTSLIGTTGVFPEAMHFLLEYARPQLNRYVTEFDHAYPGWRDGQYSGAITYPQLYLRTLLGEDREKLRTTLETAWENPSGQWLAAPAVSEIFCGTSGIYLNSWGRSLMGPIVTYDQSQLVVEMFVQETPAVFEAILDQPPKSVEFNVEPFEGWEYDPESKRFLMTITKMGRCRVVVNFESQREEQP